MNVLDLSLKYHWYDEIEAGRKPEEYRDTTDYYINRLMYRKDIERERKFREFAGMEQLTLREFVRWFAKHYDAIRFHRGQGGRKTMLLEFEGLAVGKGNPEWGAPTDREVFIIKLGKQINE